MGSDYRDRRKPNWLLRGLLAVSLGIHILVFLHVFGLYRSSSLTYIEMTVQDISEPPGRSIPRPRQRPKMVCQPSDLKRLTVAPRAAPQLKPLKVEPTETDLPDNLMEPISAPDTPMPPAAHIASCDPSTFSAPDMGDYLTPRSYLEMVRFKIERHKTYPQLARNRHIEGSVTVQFIITPEGTVREISVARSSNREALDNAAIKAVKNAAPFPKPPRRLFKGEVPLEITIVFEIT